MIFMMWCPYIIEDQDYVSNVIKFFITLVKEHAKYSGEHHLLEPLEGPHAGKFFNILLTVSFTPRVYPPFKHTQSRLAYTDSPGI
jgi:hypothetical protein